MPRSPRSVTSALLGMVLVVPLLGLGGCSGGSVQKALGIDKRAPDEFAVVSRAPLVVPPDYQLRPPRPGAPRPQVGTTSDQARASLTANGRSTVASDPGSNAPSTVTTDPAANGATIPAAAGGPTAASATSNGQEALVSRLVTSPTDPDIRDKLARENLALAEAEGELYTRLMKWQQPEALGQTVDPAAESKRLLANRIEGKAPTDGATPSITTRRQSPLGGLIESVF